MPYFERVITARRRFFPPLRSIKTKIYWYLFSPFGATREIDYPDRHPSGVVVTSNSGFTINSAES